MQNKTLSKFITTLYKRHHQVNLGNSFYFINLILSELQILGFILFIQFTMYSHSLIAQNPLFHFLRSLCKLFTGNYLTGHSEVAYCLSILWVIMLISSFVLISWRTRLSGLHFIRYILFAFLDINQSVGFAMLGTNLVYMFYENNNSGPLIVFVIHAVFTLGTAILTQDCIESLNKHKLRNRNLRIYDFVIKLIFNLLNPKFFFSEIYWILGMILVIWSLRKIYVIYVLNSFWNYEGEMTTKKFATICVLWSLTIFLMNLGDKKSLDMFYIQFILTIFKAKVCSILSRIKLINNLNYPLEKIKSPIDLMGVIIAHNYVIDQINIVVKHKEEEIKNEYLISILGRDSTWEPENSETKIPTSDKVAEIYENRLREALNYGLKKFPDYYDITSYTCTNVGINRETSFRAFKLLSLVDQSKLTWKEQSHFSVLKKIVEKRIQESRFVEDEQYLDINVAIELNQMINTFTSIVLEISNIYVSFWNDFMRSDCVFAKIKAKNDKIEELAAQVDILWDKIRNKNEKSRIQLMLIYYSYLFLIRSRPCKAQSIKNNFDQSLKQEKNILENDVLINKENMFNPENVILQICISGKKPGEIISASKSVYKQLNWSQNEIAGANTSVIMPPILGKVHQGIWKSFMKDKTNVDLEAVSYCITKGGVLKKFHVYVRLYPKIEEKVSVFCALRPQSLYFPTALVNSVGIVEGHDESFARFFEIHKRNKAHLNDIIKTVRTLSSVEDPQTVRSVKFSMTNISFDSTRMRNFFEILRVYKRMLIDINDGEDGRSKFLFELTEKRILKQKYYILEIKPEDFNEIDTITNSSSSLSSLPNVAPEEKQRINVRQQTFNSFAPKETERGCLLTVDLINHDTDMTEYTPRRIMKMKDLMSPRRRMLEEQQKRANESSFKFHAMDEPKFEKTERFKKVEKVENKNPTRNELDSHSVSSITTSKSYHKNMETLIHSTNLRRVTKYLYFVGFIVILIFLAFMIYYKFNSDSIVGVVKGEINVILACTVTKRELTRLSRQVLSYQMVGKGIWNDNRYSSANVESLRALRHHQISERAMILNQNKNQIRNSIYQLEEKFQTEILHQTLTIVDRDNFVQGRISHPFDFITELYDSALRIEEVPASEVTDQNSDVKFFVNNAFNELLLEFENIFDILLSDIEYQINSETEDAKILALVMGFHGLMFMSMTGYVLYCFMKDRNDLIEIMQTLDEQLIKIHISEVKSFIDHLKDVPSASKLKWVDLNRENHHTVKKNYHRYHNLNGLNTPFYGVFITTLGWTLIFVIPFLVFMGVSIDFGKSIRRHLNNEIRVNEALYDLDIMLSAFYFNISDGPEKTIRKEPVVEIIDIYFDKYLGNIGFFQQLNADYDDPIMTTYLTTDLCSLGNVIQTQFNSSICYSLGNGAMRRGMIGIVELISSASKTAFLAYKGSNYTLSDKIKSVQDRFLIDSEIANIYMMYGPFMMVQNRLHEIVLTNLKHFESLISKISTPFIIIILLATTVIWTKVYKNLVQEKMGWRKLCRVIPFGVASHNKSLIAFMKRNTDLTM